MSVLEEHGMEVTDEQLRQWHVFPKIKNAVIDFSVSRIHFHQHTRLYDV